METTLDPVARFHRALVEEIVRTRPSYLSEPFTVAEIYQNLVPYRTHRDRIGVEMNGDYEDALLRLLAGEGEFLVLESEHAVREIREELDSANPNTGLYRAYAAADVRLNPLRMPRDLPDPVRAPVGRAAAASSPPSTPAQERVVMHDAGHQAGSFPEPVLAPRSPSRAGPPSACVWCREPLPRREVLNYCPFCGADMTTAPCANCGEELEVGWRFCVACGTGVGDGG
jgi:hypothetical protein